MRRVLVAGGSGYLGSSLIKYINRTYPGWLVTNYDLAEGDGRDLPASVVDSPYYWVKGDVTSREQTWRHSTSIELMINCVWSDKGAKPIESSDYVETTLCGANNLAHCAVVRGTSRFVQISTADVYGRRVRGQSKESDAPAPETSAAGVRGAADVVVGSFHKQWDLGTLVIRPTNVYGPGMDEDHPLSRAIERVSSGRLPTSEFTESTARDWIHVDDFCSAVDKILHFGSVGETYNVASGELISDRELVEIIAEASGQRSPVAWSDPKSFNAIRVSTARLEKLGWKSSRNIRDAMVELVALHRAKADAPPASEED